MWIWTLSRTRLLCFEALCATVAQSVEGRVQVTLPPSFQQTLGRSAGT